MEANHLHKLAEDARVALHAGELSRAQALVETFLATEGTDRRWGLAFLDTLLTRRRALALDEEEQRELAARQLRLQGELLSADEEDESWVHRWERARQLNNRAWNVVQHGGTTDEQREALADIERSLEFWPYFLSHQDTRCRLLIGLGRIEEVYRTVRWVQAVQPGWPDFRDIRGQEAYGAWLDDHTYAPLDLPEGPATAHEHLPTLPLDQRSPPDARLNAAERRLLRTVRVGETEWHRARNAALIGVLLDLDPPLEGLLPLPPQRADLSLGSIELDGETVRPSDDTLLKLRHWMLWAANNHPSVFDAHPPPGIRQHLFHRWSQDPLDADRVEEILAEIGERTGIQGLNRWRLQPLRFRDFPGSVIRDAEERRALKRAAAADPRGMVNETVATVRRWTSRYEDTYIPYTYEVDGVGYGFVYLTPYDEIHRAFGNHPAEWYDELVCGEVFRIGTDPDDPRDHRVLDSRFEQLNGQVMFVGTATRTVAGPDDVDRDG